MDIGCKSVGDPAFAIVGLDVTVAIFHLSGNIPVLVLKQLLYTSVDSLAASVRKL